MLAPEVDQAMSDSHCTVTQRLADIKDRIASAAGRAGRDPDQVFVIAVTKTATASQVRELLAGGHEDFGESRMQHLVRMISQVDEYRQRQRELHDAVLVPETVRWHFVGHLQRNKVQRILPAVRMIHSVDSLRLAEEIQATHREQDAPAEVLIQVNITGEKSKYGVAPAAARHLVDQVDTMLGVRVRGLMCMAPQFDDPQEARPVFERAGDLFQDILHSGATDRFNILSMGMSNDFEIAVECGANLVRIGRALFGTPDEQSGDAASDMAQSTG